MKIIMIGHQVTMIWDAILAILHGQMEEETFQLVEVIEEELYYFGVGCAKDIEDMFKETLQVNMEINYGWVIKQKITTMMIIYCVVGHQHIQSLNVKVGMEKYLLI